MNKSGKSFGNNNLTRFREAVFSPQNEIHSGSKATSDDDQISRTSAEHVQVGNILNDTSTLIQNNFTYIYEFEKKKTEKYIKQVEDLFEINPLGFNDETVG